MTLQEMREFIAAAQAHGIGEAVLEQGGQSIRVSGLFAGQPAQGVAPPKAAEPPAKPMVRAERVGILRFGHPSQPAATLAPERPFKAGETLAFLQVGATLGPVLAPVDGVVTDLLAKDGDVVGYGTPLLHYATAGA